MAFEDKTLVCADCGAEFTFSEDDQEFHANRGYQEPKRCPACRQTRRAERGGGGYGRGERVMHDAVCSACGAQTQVPFEPRLDKPVYCDECFAKQRDNRPRR
jgi:CxxC-x17-CxxC domain-containing protein